MHLFVAKSISFDFAKMKITCFLIAVCCLIKINADVVDVVKQIPEAAIGIAKNIAAVPIDIATYIFSTAGQIADVILNSTLFPIIPDAKKVIPKMAKILKNFPIVPGTHWCGRGNVAHNDDSTGLAEGTDLCCREHDMCDDNIHAGDTRHGLTNTGTFTRSNCRCDAKFFNCLKATGTPLSIATGLIYFSLLGPMCFEYTYPTIKCSTSVFGRCFEYHLDGNQAPMWQWFDNPRFT